ncbi:putative ABC transporter C family member 15 [Aristolochia californica]|uniref:putative ABC transporter C family member 15 n=1 Tax=Aristolochia californica TaxID=171875 RepID=UPI0035E13F1F
MVLVPVFAVLSHTSMEWLLKVVSTSAFSLYWTWIIVTLLKQKDRHSVDKESTDRKSTFSTKIVILCNISISCSYLGFSVYEIWMLKAISLVSALPTVTWVLISIFTIYYKERTIRENKSWPLVLKFWWFLYCTLDTFYIAIFLLTCLKWISLPISFPVPKFCNFASLPFSIFLCFNLLSMNRRRNLQEVTSPLLQTENEHTSSNAFDNAGIWSRLTFRWLNPLFKAGQKEKLELSHVPLVPKPETAESSFSSLQDAILKQKTEVSSLPDALIQSIWKPLVINAIFAGINTLSSYLGPFLITNFVNFLSGKDNSLSYHYGYLLALLFFVSKTVESLSQRQWYFGAHQLGIRVRAALIVAIYTKSLSTRYGSMSSGKIINLLNVDVERIGDFLWYIHGIWLLPVQVSLALIILLRNLGGAASLAALFTIVLVMVSNIPLANLQENLHSKIMEAKDSRIKATSETLKSMRILKLHSWETTYLNKLLKLREIERNWLKRYLYSCSAIAFLFWASPTLVSVITFGVCIIVKVPLTSGAVLSALATFRILQEPIYNLPELISMIAQTRVSIDRVQEFIREEDQKRLACNFTSNMPDVTVDIEVGEYAWETNSSSNKPTVKITKQLKIKKGQKVAICGSVGSGKSSFLCSIIGEIPRISGQEIKVYGLRAYVPQSAWIQTGSVRENVLFGEKMDGVFYEEVLKGCALDKDIEMWADGDMTMVGERGINLSGGQKQRIQLARAVYSNSDVFFLDDPFSAVDAHTGAHLFKECLSRLLVNKTVIFVTHQLEFLDFSNLVLVMRDGTIVQCGKHEDLIKETDGELVRQMAAYNQSLSQVTSPQESNLLKSPSLQVQESELIDETPCTIGSVNNLSEKICEEDRETGRVKWSVYSTFISSAYKGLLVPIILLCQVLFQGLQIGSNYWIAWGSEKEGRMSKERLIGVFVLLSAGSSAFILGRAVLLSTVALETAQRLFSSMITSVFRSPMSYFDSTPSSRILNRASTDQSIVDTDIPYRLAGLAFALIQLLAIIILMSQVTWQVFLLFVIILAISIWYQAYYITTARELARMVGVRKGPILHHFSESIAGAATIRCFNQQERFQNKNLGIIDDYSRIAFHNCATMEWLCVRINFLFNLVFLFLLLILVTLPRSSVDPSLAGLAATYGLNLNVLQAWVIWNLCNVENKMISVERILQFSSLPSEAPLVIENCRPIPDWPTNGTIELDNLHVQYNPDLPMVLRGITCTFPGGKKIGIVGRTGCGKSTLIQALFRVVEPSEGRITIDSVDICMMGLEDLRTRLSIIPQDPTLFQGNVRTNLDPLQQHSDAEIWETLDKCQLGEIVRQDQRLLDAPVAEDGENWSMGQRQLVCLARVLLKKRRVLVLDEATASVDTETDNVIQKTIRVETSNCTVITVAHRIPTVIDNDLVLVLDEGKILEYDSPAQLLKDKSSAFSKLVMEFLRRSKRDHRSSPS